MSIFGFSYSGKLVTNVLPFGQKMAVFTQLPLLRLTLREKPVLSFTLDMEIERSKICLIDLVQSEWEHFFMATVQFGTPATALSVKPRLGAKHHPCFGHRANN